MPEERDDVHWDDDTPCAGCTVHRRDVLRLGSAAVLGVGLTGASAVEAAGTTAPELLPPQPQDRIQIIRGALKNQVVRPDMLEIGAKPFEAFPLDAGDQTLRRKNRLNRLLVVRLDPAEMDAPTKARSIEGVLVYSAVCTHRGCTIKSWKKEERHFRCHCHLSEFAALSEGGVVTGPARRQLPMIPLSLDEDGFVVAADGFTGKPGAAKK